MAYVDILQRTLGISNKCMEREDRFNISNQKKYIEMRMMLLSCQNGPNKRMVSEFSYLAEGIEKNLITLGKSFVVSYEFKHDLALYFVAQGKMFYENLVLNTHTNCSLWFPKLERI